MKLKNTADVFGAMYSVTTAAVVNSSEGALHFVAPNLNFSAAWNVPQSALLPLAYWILFNSCAAYLLITFGNKHAPASSVLAYTALQPVTTALLSGVLILLGPGKKFGLTEPVSGNVCPIQQRFYCASSAASADPLFD